MVNTTIQISEEVWSQLNKMKKIGENFNDVLLRVLKNKLKNREGGLKKSLAS